VGGVVGGGSALHLQRDASEVDDNLLLHVALAVGLQRLEKRSVVGVVEGLAVLEVDVEDVHVRLGVRVARLLVEAHVADLDPVDELAFVRRDLAAAAHLVRLAVHGHELEPVDGLVQAHVDHVQLEQLRAAVGDERARHHLVVLEVAREVPVVALEHFLADEEAEAVHAPPRHDVRHAVDHEHLARAELVLDARGARTDDVGPRARLVPRVAQPLHVHLGEARLVRHQAQEARGRVLLVLDGLLARLELGGRPDDALARVELLLGEEAGDAVAHLDEQLAVDVAVVLEEEHRDEARLLGEGVDLDVVDERLALLRHAEEGERRVEQPVRLDALVLEVDAEVRDEHQVALPRLDQHGPRDLPALAQLAVGRQVVLGRHRARLEDVGGGVHLGDARAEQVLALRQPAAIRVRIDLLPRRVHAREVLVEDGGDVALGVLEKIVEVPQHRPSVLLRLLALPLDLAREVRPLQVGRRRVVRARVVGRE